jgi:pimeloyl-ACP methyl ester carboxylesterase
VVVFISWAPEDRIARQKELAFALRVRPVADGNRATGASDMTDMAITVIKPRKAGGRPLLPAALNGERRESFGRAGRVSFYVAGQGAPLLLVHSINAAGSAYEVKPIFDALVGGRRVYAADLPGFGFSDRSKRWRSRSARRFLPAPPSRPPLASAH